MNHSSKIRSYHERLIWYDALFQLNMHEIRRKEEEFMRGFAKVIAGLLTAGLYIAAGTAASGYLYQPKAPEGLKAFRR